MLAEVDSSGEAALDEEPAARGLARASARLEWVVSLTITAIVLALHVSLMRHAGPLWRDEANTVHLATLSSLAQAWNLNEFDSFPMLWFLLLRGWTALASVAGEFEFRILGGIVGASLVAALWWSVRRLSGSPPLLALALFGMNPEVIRWGDSMRAYGLGTALLLVTLAAVWTLTSRPPTRRRMGWVVVLALLSAQCLYQNAVLLTAAGFGTLAVTFRRQLWSRSLCVIAAGLPAAASLLIYTGTIARASEWNPLLQVPFTPQLLWSKASQAAGPVGSTMIWVWLGLVGLSLLMAGLAQLRRWETSISDERRDVALFCGVALVAGILGYLLLLGLLSYATEPWYYIALMGFAAVCIDVILCRAARATLGRCLRMLMVVAVTVLNLAPAARSVQMRQTNVDLIAEALETTADEGDLILVAPWYYAISFGRYYQGEATWMTLPPIGHPKLHRYDLVKQRMLTANPTGPVLSRMAKTLESGHRVWVVGHLPRLARGRRPPRLPPPPAGPSGWHEAPYDAAWGLQVRHFLQRHALRTGSRRFGQGVNPYERPLLQLATGWRQAGG